MSTFESTNKILLCSNEKIIEFIQYFKCIPMCAIKVLIKVFGSSAIKHQAIACKVDLMMSNFLNPDFFLCSKVEKISLKKDLTSRH